MEAAERYPLQHTHLGASHRPPAILSNATLALQIPVSKRIEIFPVLALLVDIISLLQNLPLKVTQLRHCGSVLK